MTSEVPEEELAEQAVHDESQQDPEEYEAEEREVSVSDETGTVYDVGGAAETTPHDEEIVEAEQE